MMNNLLGFGYPRQPEQSHPSRVSENLPLVCKHTSALGRRWGAAASSSAPPREPNRKTLSSEYKGPVSLAAIIYTWWRQQQKQKKLSPDSEMCHQIAFQHCELDPVSLRYDDSRCVAGGEIHLKVD